MAATTALRIHEIMFANGFSCCRAARLINCTFQTGYGNACNAYIKNHHTRSTMQRCLLRNSYAQFRFLSTSTSPSVIEASTPKDILHKVESEIECQHGRLFAVVYLAGHQFKVTTGDLIQLEQHITADMGERIALNKVLLVGGDNFTILGRPLISPEQVRVEATVIEKTLSQKKIVFQMRQRTRFRSYKEKFINLSVLRINSIEVSPQSATSS